MTPKTIIQLCGICALAFSCRSHKLLREAESKTEEFFSALKNEDEKRLALLYPGFSELRQYYKSDSASVVSATEKKGIIIVMVNNRFANAFGKLSQQRISLYYKTDSSGKMSLYDSKGLSNFSDNDEFKFGSKTGCIDIRTDTTDQQISSKLRRAKQVLLDKAIAVYLDLRINVRVVNWNWESGFGGSASGHGIVRNSSTYNVPKLKYKVTYEDQVGNTITSDDGYVTYDVLDIGESRSFSFYTSYIGGASRASIELKFDEDMIFKYLSEKDWTGNECGEYFMKHPDMSMEK